MRAAVFRAPGVLRIEQLADPEPGPGEVLIQVRRCGIGGIDLGLTSGSRFDVAYGAVVGRECAGEVVAVGSTVSRWRAGDRVAVLPSRGCGHCGACAGGRRRFCTELPMWPGGFAEFVRVPASGVFALQDNTGFAVGALLTPLATALRGVRAIGGRRPDKVLVLGHSPVALSVAFWGRRGWTCGVHLLSRSPRGDGLARRLGAETVASVDGSSTDAILDALGGRPDVVFECVGAPGSLRRAIELVAMDGHVVSLGFGLEPDPFSPRSASAKGLCIDFPYGCTLTECEEGAAALLTSGDDLGRMVSSVVRLEELPTMFERLRRPHDELQVQVEFP